MIVQIQDLTFGLEITPESIRDRIVEMASVLREKYKNTDPLYIGILNGSFIFMADLVREVGLNAQCEFVKFSSYTGTERGSLTQELELSCEIKGRRIIIVEDIIDSGKTVARFREKLEKSAPESIEIVSLLYKPEAHQFGPKPECVGFSIPKDFVVGYGLDYNGFGRELKGIYKLVE